MLFRSPRRRVGRDNRSAVQRAACAREQNVELVGGLALLVGYKSSWAAGALAIWSLATGFAVHLMAAMHSTDPAVAFDNMIHFYKNLGVAGGLIYVVAFGAGGLSIDSWTRAR